MRIDFSKVVKALGDEPLKDEKGEEFTLKQASIVVLDGVTEETRRLEPKEKFRRGHLAHRIFGAKEPIKIDVEDIGLLKELIGKAYGPHVVFECWNLLEDGAVVPESDQDPKLEIPSK